MAKDLLRLWIVLQSYPSYLAIPTERVRQNLKFVSPREILDMVSHEILNSSILKNFVKQDKTKNLYLFVL